MITKPEDFCPVCYKFEVNSRPTMPECDNCGSVWTNLSNYWTDLDEWESEHKKTVSDYRKETEVHKKNYVNSGGLETDLAVLVAQIKFDTHTATVQKILNIMEKSGVSDPHGTLDRIAILMGGLIGDATRDLQQAKKEAEE